MSKRVAVIGFSFQLPQSSPKSFWDALQKGQNLVTQVDATRWAQDAYLHPDRAHPGTSYTFSAGSIGDVSGFDAAFFGISPREAALMDPQQRKLLEWSWEALENANVRPSSIRGSAFGVYIGIASADYSYRLSDDLAAVDSSVATGNTASIAANRLSYFLDLRGPSMAIDTACSSSLVAFHQACQSILSGENKMALTGGVSLHLHPYGFIVFSKASMLSREGRCKVFDADGDGYVRSEGGGIFVLKDYDAAVADGDPIIAVVAASAVNTDGRKTGLTVPSGQTQADLLRQVYDKAGISPAELDYLEAHGTGTAIGDPIETRAIGEALGSARPAEKPLLIGSVKSNVGHLEAASGVAGLVKALYCIQHRAIPATIGIKTLNPKIAFKDLNLQVVTQTQPLKAEGVLTIGVNSFGFGGANAHVILQSPPTRPTHEAVVLRNTVVPVILSAKTAQGLQDYAKELNNVLANQSFSLYDFAYSLAEHRELFAHRAMAYCQTYAEVSDFLAQIVQAESVPSAGCVGSALNHAQGPAFVYSGNGSQWVGMGRTLLESSSVFKSAVAEIDAYFQPLSGFSLLAELQGRNGENRYEFTEIAQPALFAVQVGVTRMLQALGIEPVATMGHSVGEVAAAWCSGALSLKDASTLIYHRSHLQGLTKGRGKMAAVGLGQVDAVQLIADMGLEKRLSITGVNSARGVTVAGSVEDLAALQTSVLAQGKFYKLLDLDYAFHSPAMDGIERDVISVLTALKPGICKIPFYSTVTGVVEAGEVLDAEYWWHNVRQPVLFEAAAKSMIAEGINLFVEIGPHTVLRSYLSDSLKDCGVDGRIVPTLTREDEHVGKINTAALRVMIAGGQTDFSSIFPVPGKPVPLPNYVWQREALWHPVTEESLGLLWRKRVHPLLGYPLKQMASHWENPLDTTVVPMLADHVVGDAVVFPGTAYVEVALAAALACGTADVVELESLEILSPLLLPEGKTKLLRTHIEESDGALAISARDYATGEAFTLHAKGRLRADPSGDALKFASLNLPATPPDFDADAQQRLTRIAGLEYGPAFQCIKHGWHQDEQTIVAAFELPDEVTNGLSDYQVHPAILDCTFQLIIQLLRDEVPHMAGIAFVPIHIGRVSYRCQRGVPAYAQALLRKRSPHSLTANFAIFDQHGQVLVVIEQARFRSVRLHKHANEWLKPLEYRLEPMPLPAATQAALEEQSLVEGLSGWINAMGESGRQDAALEIDSLLDALASRYTLETLRSIEARGVLPPAAKFADDAQRAGLYAKCVSSAQADQLLQETEQGLRIVEPEDAIPANDIWALLNRDYAGAFQLVHALNIGSEKTRALLSPQAAIGKLPVPDYAALWQSAVGSDRLGSLNRLLAGVLRQSQAGLQPGQRLNVLEVGAALPCFAHAALETLDLTRSDYSFVTTDEARLSELHAWQESHSGVRVGLLDQGACVKNIQLAIVDLNFLNNALAHSALEYAARRLCTGGVILLLGRHRSRWLGNIYPEQYDAAGNVADDWRQRLSLCGFEAPVLLETLPDALTDLFFLVATKTAASDAPAEGQDALNLLLVGPEASVEAPVYAQFKQACAAKAIGFAEATLEGLSSASLASAHHLVYWDGLEQVAQASNPQARVALETVRCYRATQFLKTCLARGVKAPVWMLSAEGLNLAGFRGQAAADSALYGFLRTALNEFADLDIRLIDLPAKPSAAVLDALLAEIRLHDVEQEVAFSDEAHRYVPRLHFSVLSGFQNQAQSKDDVVRLGFQFPGQLRHLRWERLPQPVLADDQIEVEVQATGLNFRDVMYTLGLLSDEAVENGFAGPSLGLEFSGIVKRTGAAVTAYGAGDAVVGFGPHSFANRVLTSESAIARIPEGVSFEAAATIPSVFLTVYYALKHLANLQPGEKLLIHGAAGGVGIAAIQLAKHLGAEIYATAGSEEKRVFLRNLGVTRIYDSRALSFADEIRRDTKGEGVDVVLNSLAGEAVNRNFDVLKPFGRFLELGKRDFYENTKIGLRPFRNNISYFGIDADQLMQVRPDLTKRLFAEVMALFAQQVLIPLPYQSFPAEKVVDAFRHMQQARHIGKIVVTYENDLRKLATASTHKRAELKLSEDGCYLVTGGLGGFGLRTAQWLVEKGARHLVLLSRRGPVEPETQAALAKMEAQGVKVLARACDVTSRVSLEKVFADMARTCPPLRGVVHAAVVIDDGLIQNLTPEQIERVLGPKMLGVDYLDELTAKSPLDFFVLYSSATTLFGNPGQACYVAANAYLESVAAARRARGLPATSVCWGAIDDVGFLARNTKIKDALQGRMGGQALRSEMALAHLEQMLLHKQSGFGLMELDWRALGRFLPTAGAAKYSRLARPLDADGDGGEGALDIQSMLGQMDDVALQKAFVAILKGEVGNILRISAEKIDASASIYDMGLDSLMGVELVMALEERFGTRLPVMALSESSSIEKLAERIIQQLRGDQAPSAEESMRTQVEQIAAQHGVSADDATHAHAVELVRSNGNTVRMIQ